MNRVQLALQVLFGGTKALATMVPTWRENTPAYPEVNFETMVRGGWRRNELIFACIDKTSKTAAQVSLDVYGKRDEQRLPDHPLARLLARPNPLMDQFDLWSSVIVYQKLAGRAIFEKERSAAGQVVRLWPLRPDWIKPVPSSTSVIGYYRYEVPGLAPVQIKPEDVLDFKLFDPINPYHGYPPAAVAARVGSVDNALTDYLRLFFEKSGVPPGLLKTKQKLQDVHIEDIRRRWRERYGGYEHWMDPAVLDMDAEYQKIGLDFREMGFDVLDARNEARICMVMDIPPILIGAKVGLDRSTFTNYREARQAWWEDTLQAVYADLNDAIETQLLPEFGDDIETRWDFSKVPAMQEMMGERWKRVTEAFKAGFLTVNDARREVGMSEDPRGDVYLRPLMVQEVPARAAKLVQLPLELPLPGGNGHKDAEDAPDDDDRRKVEHKMERVLAEYFGGQVDRIEQAIQEEIVAA